MASAGVTDVGISGISIYYPRNVVNQDELEEFDKIPTGKYTIGLGQKQMGFCADNEDVVSLGLTVTKKLMDEYKIDPNTIGFLEVGTETIIDKSKSVKTELMKLFPDNADIQGVDVKNACYGGTQALFHAVDWVYANYAMEQRNAIVVMADIAVYAQGNARCTGGAGAIALLITPNSCIPLEGIRGSHMAASHDFYKPIVKDVSEYPIVDSAASLQSYMNSLVECYKKYIEKSFKFANNDDSLMSFSSVMFHCPFTKMLQKGLARLAYIDHKKGKYSSPHYDKLSEFEHVSVEDKKVEKILIEASNEFWEQKTSCNLELNRRIGNMYTPSLLAQLVVHLSRRVRDPINRILLFSYGSGSASSMFSARINYDDSRLAHMETSCEAAVASLDDRVVFSPKEYTEALNMRERFLIANVPIVPEASVKHGDFKLFKDTFHLVRMDDRYRREYSIAELQNGHVNGITTNGTM